MTRLPRFELVSISLEVTGNSQLWRQLSLLIRDGYEEFCNLLTKVVLEKFHKMHDNGRLQVLRLPLFDMTLEFSSFQTIWILRELIKLNVNNLEPVVSGFLKNIGGGDLAQKNLSLADTLLVIFSDSMYLFGSIFLKKHFPFPHLAYFF